MNPDQEQPNTDLEAIALNGVHHSKKLDELATTGDAHIVEQTNTTKAVQGLEPALDAIVLNTQPKDVQKMSLVAPADADDETWNENEAGKTLWNLLRGPKGHTPVKGTDYYTPEEEQALIEKIKPDVTPRKGEHYYTPEERQALIDEIVPLATPQKGVHYDDGYTPKKGVDYDDGKPGETPIVDEEKIVTEVLARIPPPKPGAPGKPGKAGADTPEQIIAKIKGRLSWEDLTDRPNFDTYRGKGSNVAEFQVRKNGVLTVNQVRAIDFIGNWTITDLGGGAVSAQAPSTAAPTIYTETPTGAIDGVNTTYTTAHAITTIYSFAINGQFLHPSDYTAVGTTITFATPLPVELSGTPFTIIYA